MWNRALRGCLCLGLLVSLAGAPLAVACPPRPVGLEVLIQDADQAVLVEMTDVRRVRLGAVAPDRAERARFLIRSPGQIAEDFGSVLDEGQPDAESGLETEFVVEARRLAVLSPHGPAVGEEILWPIEPWLARGILPGSKAVLFLRGSEGQLDFVIRPDAVLVLQDFQDPKELAEIIEAGFLGKETGQPTPARWLEQVVRSPVARHFARIDPKILTRLPRETLARALIERPSGLYSDLAMLRLLVGYPSPDLDHLVLSMTASWLEADAHYLASRGLHATISRWRLPEEEAAGCCEPSDLDKRWREITEKFGLPEESARPELTERLAAFEETSRQQRELYKLIRQMK